MDENKRGGVNMECARVCGTYKGRYLNRVVTVVITMVMMNIIALVVNIMMDGAPFRIDKDFQWLVLLILLIQQLVAILVGYLTRFVYQWRRLRNMERRRWSK